MALLDLKKDLDEAVSSAGIGELPPIRVCLALDKSGSMHDLFERGFVDRTLELVSAVADKFDDDGMLEWGMFNDNWNECSPVKFSALQGTENYYARRCDLARGSTAYSKALQGIASLGASKGGVAGAVAKLASLFGLAPVPVVNSAQYVVLVTDGACNSDDIEALQSLARKMCNSNVFIQVFTLGSGYYGNTFTGLSHRNLSVENLENPLELGSQQFYAKLVNDKFTAWANTLK